MSDESLQLIPARQGVAVELNSGDVVRVLNTHGSQVIDAWAFNAALPAEFMSMEHTRGVLYRLSPRVGDSLYSNRRRPILTLVEDTSPGGHDTLIAACDAKRYRLLGCDHHHDNCAENLARALAGLGVPVPHTPAPLNLFMNIPVAADGTLSSQPPLSKPGDHVALRAEMACIVVFSACPQDMVPINGVGCVPTEAHYRVLRAG
ncbi:urea carboxylase-associated family protein [Verticiella sediminum]|uniref:Urea carboxylase-associated family protein n=1 Tax=Verticiella sediminum TaxID=1247510 RepID=A0A556AB87_9BURK|nr:urea carboxylase-associated family protein [Verticiella sediminum]TSH90148.1 urea carboxylase-associated family protein [Verticiella sediminum]